MSFYTYFQEAQAGDVFRNKDFFEITDKLSIINHYKDIFNAPHQHVQIEKARQALILAYRNSPFLLPGSPLCQHFNADCFYYAQLALNCPLNCSYCYLQGLYKTGHCVLFVNYKDFITEVKTLAESKRDKKIYIPLTHETDLLAFKEGRKLLQSIIPELAAFTEIQFEIRTKSVVPDFFKTLPVSTNIIYAFSLAPDEIISSYEYKTPSLDSRLNAVKTCIDAGHTVRVCFDPIFIVPEMDLLYEQFFIKVFSALPPHRVHDISYGFFRMPQKLFRYCANLHEHLYIYHAPYSREGTDITYPAELKARVLHDHKIILERFIAPEKIFVLD